MRVTEKLARYIIVLQSVYHLEVGLGEDDYEIRNQLEAEFPVLKREREQDEFNQWLWATKVEQDPRVKEIRERLDAGFECKLYHYSEERKLLREEQEALIRLLDEMKAKVQEELLECDDLRSEWEIHQRIMESKRR